MTLIPSEQRGRYSDRLRTRSGVPLTIRYLETAEAEALQAYFRNLSVGARYNRLFGAARELPQGQLDQFVRVGEDERFTIVALTAIDGREQIVGEARYAYDADTGRVEFGLSVDDSWHGHGIGAALLANLECRAAALGAERLFGDTLRSNDAMLAAARKAGYAFAPTPGDWKAVRFEKRVAMAPEEIPCAAARAAAIARANAAVGRHAE